MGFELGIQLDYCMLGLGKTGVIGILCLYRGQPSFTSDRAQASYVGVRGKTGIIGILCWGNIYLGVNQPLITSDRAQASLGSPISLE